MKSKPPKQIKIASIKVRKMAKFLAESKFLYLQKREKNKAITAKFKIKILFAISGSLVKTFELTMLIYIKNFY